MIIKEFEGQSPKIHPTAFVAENAALIGKVEIAEHVGVWYGAVIRADQDKVVIGPYSNVQDNATIHQTKGIPVILGEGVTVAHNAVVHGAKVGDNVMIGMNACVLNGAEIGENSIIAAGCVVKENAKIPAGSLVVGVPGRVVKEISPEQAEYIRHNARHYALLAEKYREGQK